MARIVINHIRAMHESDQDTYRFMRKVLHETRYIARLSVSHGPYTTGRLARSIEAKGPVIQPGFRVSGQVGSELAYADSVEGGAIPHLIYPRPPKTRLRFYWRKVGRIVTPGVVRHPGQRGKGYLAEAARTVGRRYGLRVIIY